MLITTRGIVFRKVKYGESSYICDIYTEQKGLRSYIVSSVRTRRPKVAPALLQLGSLLDMVAYFREDRELFRIKELRQGYVYEQVPFDVVRGTVSLFMVEVAQRSVKEAEGNESLFRFLWESFAYLDRTRAPYALLHLHFMLHLSAYIGFMPSGEYTAATPYFDLKEGQYVMQQPIHSQYLDTELSRLADRLLLTPREQIHLIDSTRQQRQQLTDKLVLFYQLHIDNFPAVKTFEVMQSVL